LRVIHLVHLTDNNRPSSGDSGCPISPAIGGCFGSI
jgi:hypothetical protein